jgi:hypothetical protein
MRRSLTFAGSFLATASLSFVFFQPSGPAEAKIARVPASACVPVLGTNAEFVDYFPQLWPEVWMDLVCPFVETDYLKHNTINDIGVFVSDGSDNVSAEATACRYAFDTYGGLAGDCGYFDFSGATFTGYYALHPDDSGWDTTYQGYAVIHVELPSDTDDEGWMSGYSASDL